jgi:outer membrane lipoprotein-sorting protein
MRNRSTLYSVCFLLVFIWTALLAGCGGDKKDAPAVSAAKPATQEESIQTILAKAKQMPGVTYDGVTTMKDMTLNSKVWADKGKVKVEQTIQNRKLIMYFDGEDMYQYDPVSNVAMKFSVASIKQKEASKPDLTGYADHMKPDSMKVLETVTYDGVKCRVVAYSMKEGDAAVKMWIREDYGLPMRVEMTTKDGTQITTEHKNMKVGAVAADTFKLPEDAKIQDMGDMMQRLQQKQP